MGFAIAHIIHPVQVSAASDLNVAQPITFESMRQARETAGSRIAVNLLSVQYADEPEMTPDGFIRTRDLDRSVLSLRTFTQPRKLAILRDILDRLFEASESADYLVYTNVDIGLQPHFYSEVERLAATGLSAFVINRRTVSDRYTSVAQLPEMYADPGVRHPGFDCFVFRRGLYPRLQLPDVCIGATSVGRTVLWSLAAHADRFALFRDVRLTFHIGNSRRWLSPENREYRDYNRQAAATFLHRLEAARGPCYRDPVLWPYVWDRYEELGFRPPLSLRIAGRLKRAIKKVRRRFGTP